MSTMLNAIIESAEDKARDYKIEQEGYEWVLRFEEITPQNIADQIRNMGYDKKTIEELEKTGSYDVDPKFLSEIKNAIA